MADDPEPNSTPLGFEAPKKPPPPVTRRVIQIVFSGIVLTIPLSILIFIGFYQKLDVPFGSALGYSSNFIDFGEILLPIIMLPLIFYFGYRANSKYSWVKVIYLTSALMAMISILIAFIDLLLTPLTQP
jgi:hypothetical protein